MDREQIIKDFTNHCEELYKEAKSKIIKLTPLGGVHRPVAFEDLRTFNTYSFAFYSKMDEEAKLLEGLEPKLTQELDHIVKGYIFKLNPLITDLKKRLSK